MPSDSNSESPERPTARASGGLAERLVTAVARVELPLAILVPFGVVCVLAPVWIGRYVPLLDYPNHLSMVFVWFHLKDPDWNFAPYYTINLPPLPYWAHYGIVYALSFLVGPELAQKLFLSAALLGFPLALAVFAHRMGRDPRLGLLGFPLAWSYATANGFLSYVAGIPAMLLALAALDCWAERPSLRTVRDGRWAVIAAAAGASLYFFHVLPWALFLVAGGLCALMAPRPWSPLRAVYAALPTVPAALLGVLAYRASQHERTPFNPWNPKGLGGFEGAHNDLFANLSNIPGWLINFHPGDFDEQVLVVMVACWLLLLATRGEAPEDDQQALRADQRSVRGWRLEVALLVVTTALFKLPRSLMKPFYWYAVNGRLAVIVALLGALLVRGRVVGLRRLFLYVATVAGLLYCADLAAHFRRFNQRAAGFDEVMALVPPHKQVLPIMLQLSDPDIAVNAYNQWGSYVQMRQGGYMQFNFVSEFPVRSRARLPSPQWDHPETFEFRYHERGWDYFLVRGPSKTDPFVNARDRVRLVKHAGDWELWEKLPGG